MAAPRMKVQEFLRLLPEMVHSQLPEELRGFHTVGPFAGLVKLHYGDRRRHYEVWVQQRLGIVEMACALRGTPRTISVTWRI